MKRSVELSIIIPTYNEKENITPLIEKLFSVFKEKQIKGEIIIVDDNSKDGTGDIVEKLKVKYKSIKILHRSGKLGLSSAVLDGFKIADGDILGVMDADLSHPPEKIPELFFPIKENTADFTIGSRYIPGGKIIGWNLKRILMSRGATILARPFTKVKDPMTGYFMLKKECLMNRDFDSRGFKILLELLVKANYKKVKEVPIVFINRVEGKSKADTGEIIFYIKNLIGYMKYKNNVINEFIRFTIVGGIGTIINLAILYSFTEFLNIFYIISAIIAFIVAATNNFIFNKIWTFKEEIRDKIFLKYTQFFVVSVIALLVNIFFLYVFTEYLGIYYLISQLIAIGISLIINFLGNKLWTFQK